jgi:hypothetical protein
VGNRQIYILVCNVPTLFLLIIRKHRSYFLLYEDTLEILLQVDLTYDMTQIIFVCEIYTI